MPISNTESHAGPFHPDGIVTDFPFAFDMVETDGVAGIEVARIAEDGSSAIVDPGLYDVIPGAQGGTIRFGAAPAAGDPLFILSTPSFKQLIAFSNQAPYLPEVVTDALDRAAARDIYMNGLIQRAILMPPGETVGNAPVATDRAGMVLGFDDTGNLLVSVSYSALIAAYQNTLVYADIARQAAQQSVAANIGGRPIKTISDNYTLQDSDLAFIIQLDATSEKYVEFTPASYRDGWYVDVVQYGPGAVYIKKATGIEVNAKNGHDEMAQQFGVLHLAKVSPVEGLAWGDLTGIFAPVPPPALSEPDYDGFSGTSGTTIVGRNMEKGGKTWINLSYSLTANTNNSAIQLNGSGQITAVHGLNTPQQFNVIQVEEVGRRYIRRRGSVSSMQGSASASSGFWWASHVTVASNTGSTSGLGAIAVRAVSPAGTPQAVVWNLMTNGVVGGSAPSLGTFITPRDWDTWDFEEYQSGLDRRVITYQNGRQVGPDVNLSVANGCPPITNNYGFRGNFSGTLDDIMLASPESNQGYIRSFCPNLVQQRDSDGGITLKSRGFLSNQDPLSLQYKIIKASDGSTVFDWTALPYYAATPNSKGFDWKGATARIDTPESGGYITRFKRLDIEASGEVLSNPSPTIKSGEVIYWTGQSLAAIPLFGTTGGTAGAPADCYFIHGTLGIGVPGTYFNDYDRRQLSITANSQLATFEAASQGIVAAVPRCHIIGAQGGTFQYQRIPGTPQHEAQRDGVTHAGLDFGSFIAIGGQYEITGGGNGSDPNIPTYIANYVPQLIEELEDLMAMTGRPVRGQMVPLTPIVGQNDTNCEQLRKNMWQACQDRPDLFFWGASLHDMDSDGTSPYHFSTITTHRQMERLAWAHELMMGRTTKDIRGPTLDHVTVDSATRCTVWVLNGSADSVDLINSSAHGDHRGGLRFSLTSNFSTLLIPTGHSMGAAVGGKTPINFTFAAGALAGGHIFVSGPYGSEPFNPDKDPYIRQHYQTDASMIVGIYTNPSTQVPIQPYYQPAGLGDYVSA